MNQDSRTLGEPGTAQPAIPIRLNGEPRQVPSGLTLRGLLEHLELPTDRVAVELNRAIVSRPAWDSTMIGPDAEVEVVHFVGGGCSLPIYVLRQPLPPRQMLGDRVAPGVNARLT